MSAAAFESRPTAKPSDAQFRYGVVFLIVLTLLVFEVVSPSTQLGRTVDVALASAALTVAVATSRARDEVRIARALAVSGVGLLLVLGVGVGVLGTTATFLVVTLLVAATPVTLAGGLLRLNREQGVTVQVVAGALAIYLLVGLLFASVIAFVSHVESGNYFQQGASVANGDLVYYSFTVLTTTGFGDYTAAQPVGHAIAVLEMLTGQLYLVTVIGMVVGNFTRRRRADQD